MEGNKQPEAKPEEQKQEEQVDQDGQKISKNALKKKQKQEEIARKKAEKEAKKQEEQAKQPEKKKEEVKDEDLDPSKYYELRCKQIRTLMTTKDPFPYPHKFNAQYNIVQFRKEFDPIIQENNKFLEKQVTIAGRV